MSYITDHFGPTHTAVPFGTPLYTDGPREAAAKAAKGILGDDADVYDVVTLAEFLLDEGQGDTQPAPAVATSTPVSDAVGETFLYSEKDIFGDLATIKRYRDGALMVTVNGTDVALSAAQGRELTRKFRS